MLYLQVVEIVHATNKTNWIVLMMMRISFFFCFWRLLPVFLQLIRRIMILQVFVVGKISQTIAKSKTALKIT